MLYCSEERLVPTNINLMTIESDDGMFYYVHRSLYDQAVILNDRFKGKEKELMDIIGRFKGEDVPECVSFFHVVVPEPLNILGYFLSLVEGFETMSQDIEVLCGVIHQMSAALNFKSLIGIPAEMRAQARFSLSIETEYKLSWDRFFQEALPYDEDMFLGRKEVVYATQPTQTVTAPAEGEDENGLFDWNSFVEDMDKQSNTTEKSVESVESAPEESPTEEPEDDNGADIIASLI